MARNINFVRERRKTISRQETDDRQILNYVIRGLVVLGVVILLVVGARLFLLYRIKTIQADQKSTQDQILAQEEVERNYTVFAHKLKIVSELFGKRREKQEALQYFSSLFDSNVLITQLSYTAGDEVLTFVLQANSIFTMEEVFNIMNSDDVEQRYPDIEKNALLRSRDGTYGMQITLYFGDKPAALPEAGDVVEGETPEGAQPGEAVEEPVTTEDSAT